MKTVLLAGLAWCALAAVGAHAQPSQPPQAQQAAPPATQLLYSQSLSPQAVQSIQQRLHDAGVFNGAIDGTWGDDSEQALEQFQQSRGLQVTGQMNQATAITLGLNPVDLVATAPAPPNDVQAGGPAGRGDHTPVPIGADAVRIVQSRLGELGFYRGAVDGVWGWGTQNALVRFQQSAQVPVTARLDAATVRAMGIDPRAITGQP